MAMRELALIVLLAAVAIPAAAQWRLAAPMEVPVTPGGTVEIDVTTTNQSTAPAMGSFLLRGFLPVASGAAYRSVISSDPRVGCTSQGVIAGNHVMTCFCDPITVESQAAVTTKYTITVPLSALPGTRIDFGITYQFGGGSTTGRSVAIRVSHAGAPQLRVRLERVVVDDGGDDDEVILGYYVVVANVGTADTTGPVDLDVTLSLPYGVSVELVPVGEGAFVTDGSKFRYRVLEILPPPDEKGEVFERYSPPLLLGLVALTRGEYEVIALAAGGGSPPAEARDRFTLDQLELRPLAKLFEYEGLLLFTGRLRP
jgi:hypothetical protein